MYSNGGTHTKQENILNSSNKHDKNRSRNVDVEPATAKTGNICHAGFTKTIFYVYVFILNELTDFQKCLVLYGFVWFRKED